MYKAKIYSDESLFLRFGFCLLSLFNNKQKHALTGSWNRYYLAILYISVKDQQCGNLKGGPVSRLMKHLGACKIAHIYE